MYRLSGAMSAQLSPAAGAAAKEGAAAAAVAAGTDGVTGTAAAGVAVGTAVAAGVAVTAVPARPELETVAGDVVSGLGL